MRLGQYGRAAPLCDSHHPKPVRWRLRAASPAKSRHRGRLLLPSPIRWKRRSGKLRHALTGDRLQTVHQLPFTVFQIPTSLARERSRQLLPNPTQLPPQRRWGRPASLAASHRLSTFPGPGITCAASISGAALCTNCFSASASALREAMISSCRSFNAGQSFAPPADSMISNAGDPLISSYVRR